MGQVNLELGLVAHYPFNGNANDESGNGNNGTVNGATQSTDRFRHINSAYNFDGSSNFISISQITNLSAVQTKCFWINPSVLSPNMYIIDEGGNNNWVQLYDDDSDGKLELKTGCVTSGISILASNHEFTQTNLWYSISATTESSNITKIYINGILDTMGTLHNTDIPSSIVVGRASVGNYYFNGLLNDIRIYNRALNEAEIQALYYEGQAPTISITTTPAICNQSNGTATVSITGGIPLYTIVWSNGVITPTADSLAAGIYAVNIMDAQEMHISGTATITTSDGPAISQSITNVICNGQSNGAINISVTRGLQPYTYEWSNGSETQDINGLSAGTYDVYVTDYLGCFGYASFSVQNGIEISNTNSNTNPTCGQSNGSIELTTTGGTSPYTYHWSGGQTNSTITGIGAGIYTVTIQDVNMCVSISQISLNNANAPVISVSSVQSAPCGGSGSAYIEITGGSSPFTYNWSNGFHGEDLVGYNPGIYSLTVTDNSGCIAVGNVEIPIVPLPIQPICLVTVDSFAHRNMVVWEKVSSTGVDYYKIYRESSVPNQYLFVNNVDYESMSEFIDLAANPFVRSWKYKISQVDLCGNESPLSDYHKTMHLTINQGMGNSYNLIWDDYEGYSYSTFYIHRHTNATGWVIIDSLPNTLHSFTDIPTSNGGLKYIISMHVPSACFPTSLSKVVGGPYGSSFSNMEDNTYIDVSVKITENDKMICYPNPMSQFTKILIPNWESDNINSKSILSLKDLMGKTVATYKLSEISNIVNLNGHNGLQITIQRNSLTKGLYFIELQTTHNAVDKTYRSKLIVE